MLTKTLSHRSQYIVRMTGSVRHSVNALMIPFVFQFKPINKNKDK